MSLIYLHKEPLRPLGRNSPKIEFLVHILAVQVRDSAQSQSIEIGPTGVHIMDISESSEACLHSLEKILNWVHSVTGLSQFKYSKWGKKHNYRSLFRSEIAKS